MSLSEPMWTIPTPQVHNVNRQIITIDFSFNNSMSAVFRDKIERQVNEDSTYVYVALKK